MPDFKSALFGFAIGAIFGFLVVATAGGEYVSRRAVESFDAVHQAGSFANFALACVRSGGDANGRMSTVHLKYGMPPELTCTRTESVKP